MRRPPRPSRASRGGSVVEHRVHPVVLGRRVECLGRRLGAGERQRARPEPEAVEDPPGDRGLGDEGEDSEPPAAVRAAEHVGGEDLAEEVGPGNPVGAGGSLAGRRPRSSRRGGIRGGAAGRRGRRLRPGPCRGCRARAGPRGRLRRPGRPPRPRNRGRGPRRGARNGRRRAVGAGEPRRGRDAIDVARRLLVRVPEGDRRTADDDELVWPCQLRVDEPQELLPELGRSGRADLSGTVLFHEPAQVVLGLVHAEAPARDDARGVPIRERPPPWPAKRAGVVRGTARVLREAPRQAREGPSPSDLGSQGEHHSQLGCDPVLPRPAEKLSRVQRPRVVEKHYGDGQHEGRVSARGHERAALSFSFRPCAPTATFGAG